MTPALSATGSGVEGADGELGNDPAFPHPLIVIDTPPSMASRAPTVKSRRPVRSSRSFCCFMTPTQEGSWAQRYGHARAPPIAGITRASMRKRDPCVPWILRIPQCDAEDVEI